MWSKTVSSVSFRIDKVSIDLYLYVFIMYSSPLDLSHTDIRQVVLDCSDTGLNMPLVLIVLLFMIIKCLLRFSNM